MPFVPVLHEHVGGQNLTGEGVSFNKLVLWLATFFVHSAP